MMPMIQIHQVNGQIGINSQSGQFHIHTKNADIRTELRPPTIEVYSPPPKMHIDLSKAVNALSGGKLLDFSRRIYSQMPGIAQQNIAKVVQTGDRMAAIHLGGNRIADLARESLADRGPHLQVFGPASIDNVDITFQLHDPQVNVQPGYVEVDVSINKPEIRFQRGNIDVYMKQEPAISFAMPEIDMRI